MVLALDFVSEVLTRYRIKWWLLTVQTSIKSKSVLLPTPALNLPKTITMSSTQTSQSSYPLSNSDVLALQTIMTQVAVSLLFWGISTTFSLVALYVTMW